MSLAIDVGKVRAVLLADGWHPVLGESFSLDSYEYLYGDDLLHGGGQSGVCATGFSFCTHLNGGGGRSHHMAGPLTSILAVEYQP